MHQKLQKKKSLTQHFHFREFFLGNVPESWAIATRKLTLMLYQEWQEHWKQHKCPTRKDCLNKHFRSFIQKMFYRRLKDILGEYLMPWNDDQSKY